MSIKQAIFLTGEEADFICAALAAYRYEDYFRAKIDVTEDITKLMVMSIDLQDRLKELFAEIVAQEPAARAPRKAPKMSRGRVR